MDCLYVCERRIGGRFRRRRRCCCTFCCTAVYYCCTSVNALLTLLCKHALIDSEKSDKKSWVVLSTCLFYLHCWYICLFSYGQHRFMVLLPLLLLPVYYYTLHEYRDTSLPGVGLGVRQQGNCMYVSMLQLLCLYLSKLLNPFALLCRVILPYHSHTAAVVIVLSPQLDGLAFTPLRRRRPGLSGA